jgi:hypothetical protein
MAFNLRSILNSSTTITHEKVVEIHNTKPKRICLKTCHSNALMATNFKDSDVKWCLSIPFEESIRRIFEKETGLKIYRTKKGKYWCPMKTEEEFKLGQARR